MGLEGRNKVIWVLRVLHMIPINKRSRTTIGYECALKITFRSYSLLGKTVCGSVSDEEGVLDVARDSDKQVTTGFFLARTLEITSLGHVPSIC